MVTSAAGARANVEPSETATTRTVSRRSHHATSRSQRSTSSTTSAAATPGSRTNSAIASKSGEMSVKSTPSSGLLLSSVRRGRHPRAAARTAAAWASVQSLEPQRIRVRRELREGLEAGTIFCASAAPSRGIDLSAVSKSKGDCPAANGEQLAPRVADRLGPTGTTTSRARRHRDYKSPMNPKGRSSWMEELRDGSGSNGYPSWFV